MPPPYAQESVSPPFARPHPPRVCVCASRRLAIRCDAMRHGVAWRGAARHSARLRALSSVPRCHACLPACLLCVPSAFLRLCAPFLHHLSPPTLVVAARLLPGERAHVVGRPTPFLRPPARPLSHVVS
ncbi:hypothetical protein GY45DRAFT_43573 [Cubamyces sp. BRFM 1775]|nr:hypothetical protein GY45DRAFT_43573 [Cubamyces sp. BRFM 1775]